MRQWRNPEATLPRRLGWVLVLILVIAGALLGRRSLDFDAADGIQGGLVRGQARVVDGDSLTIGRTRIRLKGIDAPEGPQTCTRDRRPWSCGEDSRKMLTQLIGGNAVSCRSRGRDEHGRVLGICSTKDRILNAAVVESGFALSYGGGYPREESAAKAARRGLWSGEFENPRTWRRGHARE